ncbi:hypothetical protein GCM10011369_03240 [Neiella marina]|uniref:Uncharacterized protein n=1 Tax=Neiella marina TaxID=508461 RepID=A0A8J2XKY5_9GAMM|nr:hypothetical protein [Neiella marina]GGA65169.1 hypothetical protein GCM10011369_03240 [Neiella marina]
MSSWVATLEQLGANASNQNADTLAAMKEQFMATCQNLVKPMNMIVLTPDEDGTGEGGWAV